MSQDRSRTQRPLLTQEQLKKKLQVTNFDPNAILRGAQLTVVGALRALQNPALFTSEHYKQAAIAVGAGIAIRVAIAIPIISIKVLLWFLSFIFNFEHATWDDTIVNGLDFISEYVLQVPFFLMTMMRYVTPTLDNICILLLWNIRSHPLRLSWVDQTYYKKHEGEDPSTLRETYYPNLRKYSTRDGSTHSKSTAEAITMFLTRFGKKAGLSLAVFALSYIPYIGRLVLPAASFYTFQNVVGLGPAKLLFLEELDERTGMPIFSCNVGHCHQNFDFVNLEPYFSRIHFTKEQKKHWFHNREGLLFGFGVGFYVFLRIPLLGVLIYGIAEASTAYLITKITDPPPPPNQSEGFTASQQEWRNKHEFLSLKLLDLDAHHEHGEHRAAANPVSTQATSSGIPSDPPPPYTEMRSR
ncbi:probable transmembrane protein UsgS [Phialocephala subalpina]|uniref:Probable transmembrane protein UsgS n=1 Tax=Phialocephala subalpina TaxID=576137 RepID=A0A1L7WXN9_9HELO|nr:probable transmembrane protein UsgS [Phialocephala subalpina]